ncbi:NAD-dependent epimerase/dehydratase family protein [Limobrevibacterium gyesilva]|uniref:NAD(P)-dependent oxidoreductase n=1 Tax=Limobrevibacterium gyesilva TaxID=2991712 RepID=A0AA42CEV6_9PROT|nr:NAD(P)-dependent oxidoreductase [Limobrevibacterium gyesilva]MCW3476523.1 NAD(P)-dependent oxidoreductase [Limobrevibacterium gyesilva]
MTVLISGGTGFVGLNLVEALLARGEHVVVVALDAMPASALRVFAGLPGRLTTEVGDVRDTEALTGLLRRHQVDRLFPFAAITSGPAREREMPERVIEVNLLGFISQLRAARDAGVARVIAPASAAVYGESFYDHDRLDEATTPCVPTGVYGTTKYAIERTGLRLGELWGVDVISARISSVFGPWERDSGLRDMIGPHWSLARRAVARREAVLPAVIPAYTWVYSRDIASGLLHLLDMANPPQRVFNICSGSKWGPVITQWADRLVRAFPGFTWRQSADPAEVNIRFTELRPRGTMDIARIAATGWSPRFQPEAAYADYAAWLTANPDALEG